MQQRAAVLRLVSDQFGTLPAIWLIKMMQSRRNRQASGDPLNACFHVQ
jgi:hypothetical protein